MAVRLTIDLPPIVLGIVGAVPAWYVWNLDAALAWLVVVSVVWFMFDSFLRGAA